MEVKIKLPPVEQPQDIVGQPEPPKSAPISRPEAKTEKIHEVIQTPDATRCEDPDQLQDKPTTTISSVPVNPSPVLPIKPLPVVPEAPSVSAPPEIKTNPPIPQRVEPVIKSNPVVAVEPEPAPAYPAMTTENQSVFAAFVQRMKNIAVEKLALLCQIASDMSKLTVQNEKGILSAEKYNDLTDSQEKQVLAIIPKAEFTYTPGQPSIFINGQPVPEIAASQFKQPQQQKPAQIQGLKTGGRK